MGDGLGPADTALPVVVLNEAGVPTTNSRNVADWFGKRHYNVLRDIEELECSPEFRALNFEATAETRQAGATSRELRSIDMTKDGLVFLIMGFTGRKAATFKEAYIARFNQMEEELTTECGVTSQMERRFRSIRDHL